MVRPGFSLAEVTVAMVLLSVGLLGVSAAGMLASRLLSQTHMREELVNRANSLRDSLAIHAIVGAAVVQSQPYRLEWLATEGTITVIGTLPDGSRFELSGSR
ncbi:MAG: type IV pilus modification PilV family protein [Gemmatimonadota bacterium]